MNLKRQKTKKKSTMLIFRVEPWKNILSLEFGQVFWLWSLYSISNKPDMHSSISSEFDFTTSFQSTIRQARSWAVFFKRCLLIEGQHNLVVSWLAPCRTAVQIPVLKKFKFCILNLNCDLVWLNLMYNLELAFPWLIPLLF